VGGRPKSLKKQILHSVQDDKGSVAKFGDGTPGGFGVEAFKGGMAAARKA
jgi:hypothetical protein